MSTSIISMASFSPPPTSFSIKPHFTHKSTLSIPSRDPFFYFPLPIPDNGAGVSASVAAVEDPKPKQKDPVLEEAVEGSSGPNGRLLSPFLVDFAR
ncbi:hypothetical protein DITRI_Ditri07aG0160600 [Diplodiscus trichospermus]